MLCGMILIIYKNNNSVSTKNFIKKYQKNEKQRKNTMLWNKNNVKKIRKMK